MRPDSSGDANLLGLHPSHRSSMRNTVIVLAWLMLGLLLAQSLPPLVAARGIAGYVPLHTLLETIAIVIAAMVFAVSWTAYSEKLPGNIVVLGCAFLGVGLLDFTHTLSFPGMPDFVTPNDSEKTINFWLAARTLAAGVLLAVAGGSWRAFVSPATRYWLLAAVLVVTAVLHWLFMFHPDWLPRTFVPGQGLTAFKIYAEYGLIALNLVSALLLWRRMRRPQPFNAAALFGAVVAMALSEFCFTRYAELSDVFALLGHIYKAVSYLFIYRAIFVATVESPYQQLYASQDQLRATLDALPDLLFEMDMEGRVHGFHSRRRDLLPSPIELTPGKMVHEVLPSDAAAVVMATLRDAHEHGWSTGKQFALQLPQGERWFELSAAPKQAANGQLPRFVILRRDITDRRRAESELADSRNLLKTVIDTVPVRIFWKDEALRYLGCNPAFARDAGLQAPEDLLGKDDYQMGWREQAELYRADDRRVIDTGIPKISYDEPQTTPDGSTLWLRTSKVPLRNAKGMIGVLGLYEDITERKQTELALRRSEANLKRAQGVAQVGSWYLDIASGRLEWTAEAYRIFGVPEGEAVNLDAFVAVVHSDDREAVLKAWGEAVAGAPYDIEHRVVAQEEVRWVRERAEIERAADGRALAGVGTVQDITARKQAEERIEYLAHFDALTGLPNRAQLDDHVKYALSLGRRGNTPLAMMFIDMDRFKDVNDTLGHRVGDALLIELARRLKTSLREEDTVSRLGGDEFIVLLADTDADGAAQVAQKLLDIIARPYPVGQYELAVTASIGIALYPGDGEDQETLAKNADTAMYLAKQEGRNCYRFFTPELQARSARHLQLVNALRHALERQQLHVVYQPQLSADNGRIVGVEALLRWQHPELGAVSPAEFIPIAEDCGLILPLGEWVLRRAVQQARKWTGGARAPLIMAVNLSTIQFRHPDLPHLVTRILNEEGLPPEYLELELTEGAAMHEPQGAIEVMNQLHERGIRMSIDDFGTGYSSLSYLKKFKVYKLKIDQSFVRDISTDPEDKAIVGAIISMAKSLGLKTIAEGVETVGQLAFLREQGCDEVQGYYYSPPLSVEQFEEFAAGRNQAAA